MFSEISQPHKLDTISYVGSQPAHLIQVGGRTDSGGGTAAVATVHNSCTMSLGTARRGFLITLFS